MTWKEAAATTFYVFSQYLPGVLKKSRKNLKSVQRAGVNPVQSVHTTLPSPSDLHTFRNIKYTSYLQLLNFF